MLGLDLGLVGGLLSESELVSIVLELDYLKLIFVDSRLWVLVQSTLEPVGQDLTSVWAETVHLMRSVKNTELVVEVEVELVFAAVAAGMFPLYNFLHSLHIFPSLAKLKSASEQVADNFESLVVVDLAGFV